MAEEVKYDYNYPVEELDKIIVQWEEGIIPMIDDLMMTEVRLRWKEKQREECGLDDEEELDEEELRERHEMVKRRFINDQKKASKKDVIIIKVSDEQKAEIRKQMSVSIVRPDPNSAYNISNDNMYKNEARRKIYEKLKSIRNCYYNQEDYVNAFKIIQEAIDLSLGKYGEGDYPWMSYEEAVKMFNAGKIQWKYCAIPKLYINHSTMITDKEILKGVITGDVILRDKSEDEKAYKNSKKHKKAKPVTLPYEITGAEAYLQMVAAHNQGYDTPMSTAIRHKNSVYNPGAIPFGNRFNNNNNMNKNGEPVLFDWTKDGAGDEYYELTRGRKTTSTDIIRFLNKENNDMLNSVMTTNAQEFLKSMKTGYNNTGGYDYKLPNYAQQPVNQNMNNINENAERIENELINSIRINDPSK